MKVQGPTGEIEVSTQEYMKAVVRSAWQEFEEIAKAEEEAGYQDEMITMDKTRSEGYARAYKWLITCSIKKNSTMKLKKNSLCHELEPVW